jgi:hypothetical protein
MNRMGRGPAGRRAAAVARAACAIVAATAVANGAAGGPAAQASLTAAKGSGGTAAQVDSHRAFPGARLLALADDQLLLWEPRGRAQVRGKDGQWGSELQLPVAAILDVTRDGAGFLVAGSLQSGGAAVVALSAAGLEHRRWLIPGDGAYAVFTDAAGRHAVTRGGIVDLRLDGSVARAQPFPADPRGAAGGAGLPVVLARAGSEDGALVICAPSSLAMAHPARGECVRTAPGGWKLEADFLESPIACGGAIAIIGAPARGGGAKEGEVVLYSWDTGQRRDRLRASAGPRIACAPGGDALLIGDNSQLRLLRLPSLQTASVPKVGRGPVRDVAITDHLIAYRAGDSLDVVVIPRPPAPR